MKKRHNGCPLGKRQERGNVSEGLKAALSADAGGA